MGFVALRHLFYGALYLERRNARSYWSMVGWKKILYEKQGFPDHYVDKEQFLNGLKKNLYVQTYELRELILASGAVLQELSSVCLFVALYWFVQEQWLAPSTLFTTLTALTTLGFLTALTLLRSPLPTPPRPPTVLLSAYVQPAILFILFLAGVAPIMRTLTESISTDTVWAMTVGMLTVHMLFYSYDDDVGNSVVSDAVSLNAAIFGAVCLASRLPTALHSFVIAAFAVVTFALWPDFRRRWKVCLPPFLTPLLSLLLALTTATVVGAVSLTALSFYLTAVVCVTFLCPYWLYKLQHLKNNIYGPWDEAVVGMAATSDLKGSSSPAEHDTF